jgi:hypothetical protein
MMIYCNRQVHRDVLITLYILIIKPTRCTNFSNLFLELLASSQHNLYDIYLYSAKPLMMDRETVRNM